MTVYDGEELRKQPANFTPLSPVTMLKRTAHVYGHRTATIHGDTKRTWAEVGERCRRLASALEKRGIGKGDTVALFAPNVPEAFECTFAVPMIGAVLNANNTRLDAETIGYILDHGEAKILLVDTELSEVAKAAIEISGRDITVIDIVDPTGPGGARIGETTYEDLPGRRRSRFPLPPARRRMGCPCAELHFRHHRAAQGRRLFAPRRLYQRRRQRDDLEHDTAPGLSLDGAACFIATAGAFPGRSRCLAGTHVFHAGLRAPGRSSMPFADHGVTHLGRGSDHHVSDRRALRPKTKSAISRSKNRDDDRGLAPPPATRDRSG